MSNYRLGQNKLTLELDAADKRHYDEKEAIENKMFRKRDQLEKEMVQFEEEIKIIETYDDLFSYPSFIIPIKELNAKYEELKERKNILENEENILTGYKSAYESYFRIEKQFEPHYLLWSSAESFINEKKIWKVSPASKLNIEEITKLKTNTQNTLRKLKGKFSTKQNQVLDGLYRQIKDLESWMPIIENLCNPGLKNRHWDQIKTISGPDLDFK